MKIFNLEATNMGNNQQEIADKCYEYIADHDFNSVQEFERMESKLIRRACADLGWQSVPSAGGLVVNWDSPTGDFA